MRQKKKRSVTDGVCSQLETVFPEIPSNDDQSRCLVYPEEIRSRIVAYDLILDLRLKRSTQAIIETMGHYFNKV